MLSVLIRLVGYLVDGIYLLVGLKTLEVGTLLYMFYIFRMQKPTVVRIEVSADGRILLSANEQNQNQNIGNETPPNPRTSMQMGRINPNLIPLIVRGPRVIQLTV